MVGKLKNAVLQTEKQVIEDEIENQQWNLSRTAEALGVDRKTLYNKMSDLGIKVKRAPSIKRPNTYESIGHYSPKIYLALDHHTGLIKIGRSRKPDLREKNLQSIKASIELLFISPPCTGALEKVLHAHFKHKRVRGEWFKLSDDDIQFIRSYKYAF